MTIGVCGPIDLKLLEWDLKHKKLPDTNAFPLTSHFINALLKRGFKVIGYTNSSDIEKPEIYESGNLKICIGCVKPKPGRRFFKFEIEQLYQLIVAHPANFISAFWSYEYAWAALKTNIPTAVNIHDVAHKILLKQPDLFRLVRWMMNYMVVSKAQHLIANSSYTFSILNRAEKIKAIIINNFYADSLEQVSSSIPVKKNTIISVVQGFTKRKNIHKALFAFAKVHKIYPDLQYHLVGVDMEENGPAHQFAKNHGIDKGVVFIGPQPFEEVIKHTAMAKVLLHPSAEESFGMAILEAMVSGTAVVGGKNSGFVPYLLNHGDAGILCDISSSDEMATAVLQLIEDEDIWRSKVENAKYFAQMHFSEEVIIQKHLNYYSEILGQELIPTSNFKALKTQGAHAKIRA